MKVLITGGAGFIGANLVRALTNTQGVEEVSVIDDLSFGHRSNLDGLDVEAELVPKVTGGMAWTIHNQAELRATGGAGEGWYEGDFGLVAFF